MNGTSAPRVALVFVALAGLAAVVAACGAGRRGEPLVQALDLADPAVARGRIVYAHHCEACHPGGEAGLGPSLNDKPLPAFLMRFQVRHGLGVMPAFPHDAFGDRQLDDLMAFIKARRALEPR